MPSAEARRRLLFMETRPEVVGVALEVVDIAVGLDHGFLVARLPNGKKAEGTSLQLLSSLHELTLWDQLQSHGNWPIIHGATLRIGDKRILLIGDKGQGKSTLAIYLLTRGHRVEGDEHLAVGSASVVARPRTLRVKAGSFAMVPQVPQIVRDSPSIETWDGIRVHAVDPSAFGRPWRIEEGQLDAVVVLEPNHGGRSVATPISADACFNGLMANGHLGDRNVLPLVVRLRALAARTPAYSLRIGDLETAEWHLRNIAAA